MKPDLSFLKQTRLLPYLAVAAGTFLIMAVLVLAMVQLTQPPATNSARVQERHKNLKDLQAANSDVLNNYAMEDPGKGIVRLPVDRAVELTLQEWKNPSAARSNLLERLAKKTYVPPKAPEKPSALE